MRMATKILFYFLLSKNHWRKLYHISVKIMLIMIERVAEQTTNKINNIIFLIFISI